MEDNKKIWLSNLYQDFYDSTGRPPNKTELYNYAKKKPFIDEQFIEKNTPTDVAYAEDEIETENIERENKDKSLWQKLKKRGGEYLRRAEDLEIYKERFVNPAKGKYSNIAEGAAALGQIGAGAEAAFGGALDVGSAFVPDFIEEPIKEGAGFLLSKVPFAKDIGEYAIKKMAEYEAYKNKMTPDNRAKYELGMGALSGASAFPLTGFGVKAGKKIGQEAIKTIGEQAIKPAKQAIVKKTGEIGYKSAQKMLKSEIDLPNYMVDQLDFTINAAKKATNQETKTLTVNKAKDVILETLDKNNIITKGEKVKNFDEVYVKATKRFEEESLKADKIVADFTKANPDKKIDLRKELKLSAAYNKKIKNYIYSIRQDAYKEFKEFIPAGKFNDAEKIYDKIIEDVVNYSYTKNINLTKATPIEATEIKRLIEGHFNFHEEGIRYVAQKVYDNTYLKIMNSINQTVPKVKEINLNARDVKYLSDAFGKIRQSNKISGADILIPGAAGLLAVGTSSMLTEGQGMSYSFLAGIIVSLALRKKFGSGQFALPAMRKFKSMAETGKIRGAK